MIFKFFIFSVTVSEMIDTTQGNILKGWKKNKVFGQNWQNRLSQWAPESKNKFSS